MPLPVLDTVVLFGAADVKDPAHERSIAYLDRLSEPSYYLAGFALVEFDIVMKSRGLTHKERMMRHALLARDYPATTVKVRPISPHVLYLAATIEDEDGIDYFDAGVAAEAKVLDGKVVSTDRVFDRLRGLGRTW
jgi:predicted nucleic acid-binding protein